MSTLNEVAPAEAVEVQHQTERRTPPTQRQLWTWRIVLAAVVVGSAASMWTGASSEGIGTAAIVMMLGLLALKIPVAVATAVPGLLGLWAMVGVRAVEGTLQRTPFDTAASWSLTVIPMFVLMGVLLFHSGITGHLYGAAKHWVGWLPGGLAGGTTVAGAGFASLSGSTLGSVFPLTRAGMPEMLRAGYDRRMAIMSVMAAGTLAHLIPPSLLMVIYSGVAQTSVGPQLMAGLVPGLLLTLLFVATFTVVSILRPAFGGRSERQRSSWSERWSSLVPIWPAPVLLAVVVGGLYGGWFTATEAGAVGALGALVIAVAMRRKEKPLSAVAESVSSTVATVGALFFLMIGAHMFSRLLSLSGLADGFVEMVIKFELGRVEFLVLVTIVYLVLGMFMESLVIMLLTVPVLLPLLAPLDISTIWFGVFVVILMELAMITPPVGVLSYVVHGILQDTKVNIGQRIPLSTVLTAACWVIPVPLLLIALMVAFPEIATWLPDRMAAP
ncbi:TRAP transporter large permease [Nocardioides campestrisoli]|uniref:TRAP transporter large permease n=1 Tax=Nocardioides campestrisoli TaxID=2736757 RepID=UPI0015E64EB1|nr:TRAP transporter large permease subunit [Nocardioides campestrisoli]